jgi:hypothetical protein
MHTSHWHNLKPPGCNTGPVRPGPSRLVGSGRVIDDPKSGGQRTHGASARGPATPAGAVRFVTPQAALRPAGSHVPGFRPSKDRDLSDTVARPGGEPGTMAPGHVDGRTEGDRMAFGCAASAEARALDSSSTRLVELRRPVCVSKPPRWIFWRHRVTVTVGPQTTAQENSHRSQQTQQEALVCARRAELRCKFKGGKRCSG